MSLQTIIKGDCLDVFRDVRGLGAIVSDLPSGTGFMGRGWDKDRGGRSAWIAYWAERLAVARDACVDDAVGLFWALPRTAHWTATAVEDAGWRIQDVIVHVFGQGWPKGKSALKPAAEHWILARKGSPGLGIDACRVLRGGENLGRQHGSNAFGIVSDDAWKAKDITSTSHPLGSWPTNFVMSHAEGCQRAGKRTVRGNRPASGPTLTGPSTSAARGKFNGTTATPSYGVDGTEAMDAWACVAGCDCGAAWQALNGGPAPRCGACGQPGWWACPVAEMDAQSGITRSSMGAKSNRAGSGCSAGLKPQPHVTGHADEGGASRFFPSFAYYAKAPSGERHAGCEDLYWRLDKRDPFGFVQVAREEWASLPSEIAAVGNAHPTVKRIALMRWLHSLANPRKLPVGDLCGGSGSGAIAAHLDDIDWIGAEVSVQAVTIAEARLAFWRGLTPEQAYRFTSLDTLPARPGASAERGLYSLLGI